MSDTAYDTAWVARVRDPRAPREPAFPTAFEWLIRHQHPDGSWGGTIPLLHDRVVSTLIATITLAEQPGIPHADAVARAVAYLERALVHLDEDVVETVGFELIMPTLLARAQKLQLKLPYEQCSPIYELRADKLRRLPMAFVYSGLSPLTHSLEFLGDEIQPQLARRTQAQNGSFAASPSATACFLLYQWDEAAAAYLRSVLALSAAGGACNVFPFEVFEKGWVLSHLGVLARAVPGYRRCLGELASAWSPIGVGFTSTGIVPDGDDTAIVFRLLHGGGHHVQPEVFRLFEADDYFFTFPLERNQSVSANAHVLHALQDTTDFRGRQRMIDKATSFLRSSQLPEGAWQDKWHASPYYATGRVILALTGSDPPSGIELVGPAIDWLMETQHENGSWSAFDPSGTCEETAYALQGLASLPRPTPSTSSAMARAASYLWEHIEPHDYPELWVGKGLYAPYAVIRAAILGALYAYEQMQLA